MKKRHIEFFWEGDPPRSTFQQRSRNFVPTPSARLAAATWQAILEQHVPETPFEGPLELNLGVTFRGKKSGPKITRPDGVNILKGVEDIMTRLGYWHDDAQIYSETVRRYTGPMPGVYVRIREV